MTRKALGVIGGLALLASACQSDSPEAAAKEARRADAKAVVESLKAPLARSADGLRTYQTASGATAVDLQGGFQSAAIAKIGEDGKLEIGCVDTVEDAEAFLNSDTAVPQ